MFIKNLSKTLSGKLVIVNSIIYLICLIFHFLSGNRFIIENFALNPNNFQIHQLFTHQFLHGGVFHLFFNMIGLYTLGIEVEEKFKNHFLVILLTCGAFGGITHLLVEEQTLPLIGSSGAVFGLLAIFTILHPDMKLAILFLPIGIKAKYLTTILMIIEIISLRNSSGTSHIAHIGGFITGYLIIQYKTKYK